jgi:hypothetical protein
MSASVGRKSKPYFSPVPVRAIGDKSLTALAFRVLACISWHDRFGESRGSKGCYASNRTLADEVRCTIHSLSRIIALLIERKYIVRVYGGVPGKRHLTRYWVIHDRTPIARGDKSPEAVDEDRSTKSFVCASRESIAISTRCATQEISLSDGIDTLETSRNSETFPTGLSGLREGANPADHAAAAMTRIEGELGRGTARNQLRNMLRVLKRIHESRESSLSERTRALRLIDNIHDILDGAGR